jgi:SAM-dependent methyltransferase
MEGALKYDRQIDLASDSSVARLLEWLPHRSTVLEIGPATGVMTKLMTQERAAKVTALEIDPDAAAQARRWCERLIVGNIEDPQIQQGLKDQRFDVVVCADVLEHLTNPWAVLTYLTGLLKPDGEVLISIPNVGHAGVLAELFSGHFRYRRDGLLDETHLRFFTRASVEDLLARAGLEALSWGRTLRPPLFSEFRPEMQSLSRGIQSLLSSLPDADTYQFLVRAKRTTQTAQVQQSARSARNIVVPPSVSERCLAQLFFNTGAGFSEPQSAMAAVPHTHVHTRISFDLPAGVSSFRFDPVDTQDWFRIEEMRLTGQSGKLLWTWHDGSESLTQSALLQNLEHLALETGTIFLPSSIDPQIIVELPEVTSEPCSLAVLLSVGIAAPISMLWEQRNQRIEDLCSDLAHLRPQLAELRSRNQLLEEERSSLVVKASVLEEERSALAAQLHHLYSSRSWRITKGLRGIGEIARWLRAELRMLKRRARLVQLSLREHARAAIRARNNPRSTPGSVSNLTGPYPSPDPEYHAWRKVHEPSEEDLRFQTEQAPQFSFRPVISIILPVYRPKVQWLREAIESVREQTYPFWELCIADDASRHPGITALLEAYAREDPRIKVVFREQNGHIAAASSSALELASGEYIALLDHDDALAPWALFTVASHLNAHPETDYLYSDEDKLNARGERVDPAFKPAWSPEYLLSFMYVGHLSVYRRAQVLAAGGFLTGTEGSQDYDLCLRVTERTNNIWHLPGILYHWRMHGDSVALHLDAKPYAFTAAKQSLCRALERRGLSGATVTPTAFAGVYRPRIPVSSASEIPQYWAGVGEPPQNSAGQDRTPWIAASDVARLPEDTPVLVVDGRSSNLTPADCADLAGLLMIPGIGAVQGVFISGSKVLHAGYSYEGTKVVPRFSGLSPKSPGPGARLAALSNTAAICWSNAVTSAGILRRLLLESGAAAPGAERDVRWSLIVRNELGKRLVVAPGVSVSAESAVGMSATIAVPPEPPLSVGPSDPTPDPFYPQHLDRTRFDFTFRGPSTEEP